MCKSFQLATPSDNKHFYPCLQKMAGNYLLKYVRNFHLSCNKQPQENPQPIYTQSPNPRSPYTPIDLGQSRYSEAYTHTALGQCTRRARRLKFN